MLKIDLSLKNIGNLVEEKEFSTMLLDARKANSTLMGANGKGSDYLGWVTLPESIEAEEVKKIISVATEIRVNSELVIIVGIGGSYLGSKAVIDALSSALGNINKAPRKDPIVIYAGHQISGAYANEVKELIKHYETSVVVISKSGTTTEPAIAFRFIKEEMEQKYGIKDASSRIIAITDEKRGALKQLAIQQGYETFNIPDNVGGRYSVLTAVGLLPIAIAGFDIKLLIEGAAKMCEIANTPDNIMEQYAAIRNLLYSNKKNIEILASFEPKLQYFTEWWKQLYGESEGKEGKGIFPASVIYSSDLHSMGQYVQDGERTIFETFIKVATQKSDMEIKMNVENLDGLNFLAGMKFSEVNAIAEQATILAHVDGGVPCIEITMEKLDEINVGALIYFFQRACGISGYMLDVNPFDQPGVEEYKNNMYALLGKEGYKELKEELENRLK